MLDQGQQALLHCIPDLIIDPQTFACQGDNPGSIRVATEPGQVMSVNKLEPSTPMFIAQLKGTLTNQQYKYATGLLINSQTLPSSFYKKI